jgi:cytochrome-b5 reductase
MVKKYPDGKASTYLHSLSQGDSLYFLTPFFLGYKWTPNQYPHITLIAGGAGITPIYQLLVGILNNPEDKTRITLVFGVNSDADVLLREEFQDFEQRFPGRFKAVYTVSNPIDHSPFRKGYVTKELLEEVGVEAEKKDTKVFLCGPPAFEKALLGARGKQDGILGQLGYRKDQIHAF